MKIAQPVMQKRQAEIKSKFSGDPKKQQEELGKLMNEFGSPLSRLPSIDCTNACTICIVCNP